MSSVLRFSNCSVVVVSLCCVRSFGSSCCYLCAHDPGVLPMSHSYRVIESDFSELSSASSRRRSIEYRVGSSRRAVEASSGELDGLRLVSFVCKSSNLFSYLRGNGIFSVLINHFAACESLGVAYSRPCSGSVGRGTVLFKCDRFSGRGVSSVGTQYRLFGGMLSYWWIVDNDPEFFSGLYRGVSSGLCYLRRIDICSDHSEDLMGLVSNSVRRGTVHCFKNHLRGYGVVDGVSFSDKRLGRQTSFFNSVKKSCTFRVCTLYSGHRKNSDCVISFYDKSLEQESRDNLWIDNTRIEISLYGNRVPGVAGKYDDLMKELLYSLTFCRGEMIGQHFRHTVFTFLLFSHIQFSSTVRNRLSPFVRTCTWSPWYSDLFKAYMFGTVVNTSFDESSLLSFLSTLKEDPSRLLTVLDRPSNLGSLESLEKVCKKEESSESLEFEEFDLSEECKKPLE